jgi:predicted alpha/beta hydrolase family esterase
MKRVVIVHCWEGYPNYCWYPQTKKELEKEGFEVEIPEMPETVYPKLSGWLPKLGKTIKEPDENLFLVGHSLGCITIMRYLESLNGNKKVGGVVFVAGFTDDLGYKELTNFFVDPIDLKAIKKRAKHFYAINSDDDPFVSLKYGEELKEKLGAKLIIRKNMKHFSGPIDDEKSCLSLPEVTKSILKMAE